MTGNASYLTVMTGVALGVAQEADTTRTVGAEHLEWLVRVLVTLSHRPL